jgi:hypothetical protein
MESIKAKANAIAKHINKAQLAGENERSGIRGAKRLGEILDNRHRSDNAIINTGSHHNLPEQGRHKQAERAQPGSAKPERSARRD